MFGKGCQIDGSNIHIHPTSLIGEYTWMNSSFPESTIIIGELVLIGRRNLISTGGRLEIGSFCVFSPNVYVADIDHIFDDPFQPIMQQGATRGGGLTIEENCWIGWNCAVLANIGRGSIIGANSMVKKEIPPFCVAAGNPAKIRKLWNPVKKIWDKDIEGAMKDREQGLPDRTTYYNILKANNKLTSIYRGAIGT